MQGAWSRSQKWINLLLFVFLWWRLGRKPSIYTLEVSLDFFPIILFVKLLFISSIDPSSETLIFFRVVDKLWSLSQLSRAVCGRHPEVVASKLQGMHLTLTITMACIRPINYMRLFAPHGQARSLSPLYLQTCL